MKKLSKTIFTSPDDNFKNKRLPKNCTVLGICLNFFVISTLQQKTILRIVC